jgi:hypothetical protein
MGTRVSILTIAVLLLRLVAPADTPVASMSLPVPAVQLAAAIGLNRSDTANLPIDLVRSLYASPENGSAAAGPRAAVRGLLGGKGTGPDRLPLPLGATFWRQGILLAKIPDDQMAAAILGRRAPALVYHGLLALDPETLEWLSHNGATVELFRKHPGATAVFARSLHIRDGDLVVPPHTAELWTELVGAPPTNPQAFIERLFEGRNARLAFLFDTIVHLDEAHQKFALAPARGDTAVARARALLDVVADTAPTWKIEDRPFMRPDVDVALLLRLVAVTDAGTLENAGSRNLWERGFGDRLDSNLDSNDGPPIDAAWLAGKILRPPALLGRQRLDVFLQAQRVLTDIGRVPAGQVLEALRGFTRYPALAATMERNGVRGVAAYATAEHVAAALQQDPETLALGQSLVALIDGARAAGSLTTAQAAGLVMSLFDAAGAGKPAAPHLAKWVTAQLLPALSAASDAKTAKPPTAETIVVNALGGRLAEAPPTIQWEGRPYQVDVAAAERERIERIRKAQTDVPLEHALQNVESPPGVRELVENLTSVLYAVDLGEPDGQAASGGAVWQRHKFRPDAGNEDTTWRIATENFGAGGWHLNGSLLALEAAMPRLALRRLDASTVPAPTQLSTSDRRTLSLTIALMERPMLTAAGQEAAVSAIARGRDRLRQLSTDRDTLTAVVRDAGLSEWRANGVAWMLDTDPGRVASLFTIADVYRLGGGRITDGPSGGAALSLDGSLALRSVSEPWEEYAGRPSTGQLGSQLVDVQLRTAEALAEFGLPASIARDVAAFAMQDVLDRAQPAYFDDFLSLAFTARDLDRDRFEDYVAALAASGPLRPATKGIVARH